MDSKTKRNLVQVSQYTNPQFSPKEVYGLIRNVPYYWDLDLPSCSHILNSPSICNWYFPCLPNPITPDANAPFLYSVAPRQCITSSSHVGLMPPALCTLLLFLRLGFGIPGVLGLLSDLLPFLAGGMSVFKGVGGALGFPAALGVSALATVGTISLSFSFLPVVERWKSPGWPVIGFSSMYSSPYLSEIFKDSSRSRTSR
jgi:hypothetical protein